MLQIMTEVIEHQLVSLEYELLITIWNLNDQFANVADTSKFSESLITKLLILDP